MREDGARLWEQQSGGSAEPARSAASPHCGQGQKWDAKESQSRKEEYIGEAKWDGKGSGVYSAAGKAEWQQGGSTDCRQQGDGETAEKTQQQQGDDSATGKGQLWQSDGQSDGRAVAERWQEQKGSRAGGHGDTKQKRDGKGSRVAEGTTRGKWDGKGSDSARSSEAESDEEMAGHWKQEAVEAERDYVTMARKVSGAEAELRRLESVQRKVTKETAKMQTIAEKMGLGSWRDIDPGHLVKVSMGEACRELGFPIMDGTGEEIVVAAAAATSMKAVREATKKVWKGRDAREVFTVKKVRDWQVFNYDGAVAPHFDYRAGSGAMGGITAAVWRRECRGLVVGEEGIVARPMHKFFEEDQVTDSSWGVISGEVIQDARQKLDGTMVFGVVDQGGQWIELWTRAGPTDPGKWATEFAETGVAGDIFGLVASMDECGYTACFEFIGRQCRIKELHADTGLVLTQARHKVTGGYMDWQRMQQWAASFGVRHVELATELIGMTVKEASAVVTKIQAIEGFVVHLQGGGTIKMKTHWWHGKRAHRYERWHSKEQRQAEEQRRLRKVDLMQRQGCRAVLQEWPTDISPALVLEEVESAVKVEAFYDRSNGWRGAMVLSFKNPEEREAASVSARGKGMVLKPAYSSRSNSNAYHRIRTWWAAGCNRSGG